jgi:hypothetical protein
MRAESCGNPVKLNTKILVDRAEVVSLEGALKMILQLGDDSSAG